MLYADGQEVRLGDLVDMGDGKGATTQVVALVSTEESVEGMDAREWDYFHDGLVLRHIAGRHLIHLQAFTAEHHLVSRG
ncbi:MAG: hypothetical protein ACREO3_10340 [Arenimonas sp.]